MKNALIKNKKKFIAVAIIIMIILVTFFTYDRLSKGSLVINSNNGDYVLIKDSKNNLIYKNVGPTKKLLKPGEYTINIETDKGQLLEQKVTIASRKTIIQDFNNTANNSFMPIASYDATSFSVWEPNQKISLLSSGGNLQYISTNEQQTKAFGIKQAVFISPEISYAIDVNKKLLKINVANAQEVPISEKVNKMYSTDNILYFWTDKSIYKISDGAYVEKIWETDSGFIHSITSTKDYTYLSVVEPKDNKYIQKIIITNKNSLENYEKNYEYDPTTEESADSSSANNHLKNIYGNPYGNSVVIKEGPRSLIADKDLNQTRQIPNLYAENFVWSSADNLYYNVNDTLYRYEETKDNPLYLGVTNTNNNIRHISTDANGAVYISYANDKNILGIYKINDPSLVYENILNYFPYLSNGCEINYLNLNIPQLIYTNGYSQINRTECFNNIKTKLLYDGFNKEYIEKLNV